MAANFFSTELSAIDAGSKLNAGVYKSGTPYRPSFKGTLALASQGTGQSIAMVRLPKGAIPVNLRVTSDTSLGASTIAIGNAAVPDKYRSAGTFTTVNQPVEFMKPGAMAVLAADEEVILTTAAAVLPASGTLTVEVDVIVP